MRETHPLLFVSDKDSTSTSREGYNVTVTSPSATSQASTLTSCPASTSSTQDRHMEVIDTEGRDKEDQQQQETVIRSNNNGSNQKLMSKLLEMIKCDNIEEIFNDKVLHYYLMKMCVVLVIGKRKWKEYCGKKNFDEFIHPSDESFALLVIENNLNRYKDMVKAQNKNEKNISKPKYTMVTRKGEKTMCKGWSDEGKI